MSIKIVKLTPANVEALELMAPGHTSLLEITKTTATFVGLTAREALGIVARMRETAGERYGRKGGAYQSLHAVIRKLETAVRDADAERDAATDPLVTLLSDEETVAEALGTTVENLDRDFPATPAPVTGLTVGAAIRPKAWVTAHVVDEPVRERVFRSKPGAGRVGGRLLVKCGRRRNRG
jgi:hypothetical protein